MGEHTFVEEAVAQVVRVDPAFARVVAAVGPFAPRPPQVDYFNALARAIGIGHQGVAARRRARVDADAAKTCTL